MANGLNRKHLAFKKCNKDIADLYKPIPASEMLPEWYKELETYIPKEKKPGTTVTVKKCVPVFDAITAGYLILLPCDVYVKKQGTELFYDSKLPDMVEFHPRKQAYNHPEVYKSLYSVPKWINYWSIKTPKGYSVLFTQPAHRELPFTILPGIVDADTYYVPVNFPFIMNDPNFEGLIPAGTPIAQVIPIKREKWTLTENNKESENKISEVANQLSSKFFDRYRNLFWHRKEYK